MRIIDYPKPESELTDTLDVSVLHVPATMQGCRRAWQDVFSIGQACFVVSIGNLAGDEAQASAIRHAVRAHFDSGAPSMATRSLVAAAETLFSEAAVAGGAAASALVGIVDCQARTFTYYSLGHQPPLLRDYGGELAALPGDIALPPAERDHPPAQVVVDLHDTAVLLLCTGELGLPPSGLVAEGGLQLGSLDTKHGMPPGGLVFNESSLLSQGALADERITQPGSGLAWVADELLAGRPHADVAVLALRFERRGGASDAPRMPLDAWPRWTVSWSFEATSASSHGARRAFLACLTSKAHASRAIDLSAAELIYGELLGNVVRHAPGPVEIALEWTSELPVLHVRDNGPGFRSRRSRERLPVDDLSESGRGLFIINALAAKFSVHNANGRGTHASATLPPA